MKLCKRTTRATAMLAGLVLASVSAVPASAAIYMTMDGITGSIDTRNYRGAIGLDTANWGISIVTSDGVGSGRIRSTPVLDDFSWTQDMDQSFPQLITSITSGRAIPTVYVDWVQTNSGSENPEAYFQMEFKDVLLTDLKLASTSGGTNMDLVNGAFDYEEITATYTIFGREGRKIGEESASYNVRTGEGSLAAVSAAYFQGISGPAVSAVPIPAAGWLLASAVLGLVGVSRRRQVQG